MDDLAFHPILSVTPLLWKSQELCGKFQVMSTKARFIYIPSKTLNLAQKVETTSASYQAPVRGEPARSPVQRIDDGKTWCISKGYDTSSGNDETPNGRERSKRT
ncbi:hypothetical protein Tco_0799544 [Tanacetum coccineum]|uniref:Uncharacterized protein n=1 Tax=Tanacetum coccineum TaxID=301880 RepID=A0ABQ4ZSX4_9ASTR